MPCYGGGKYLCMLVCSLAWTTFNDQREYYWKIKIIVLNIIYIWDILQIEHYNAINTTRWELKHWYKYELTNINFILFYCNTWYYLSMRANNRIFKKISAINRLPWQCMKINKIINYEQMDQSSGGQGSAEGDRRGREEHTTKRRAHRCLGTRWKHRLTGKSEPGISVQKIELF